MIDALNGLPGIGVAFAFRAQQPALPGQPPVILGATQVGSAASVCTTAYNYVVDSVAQCTGEEEQQRGRRRRVWGRASKRAACAGSGCSFVW